uniref:Capsid protein n=1 Tax=Citrus leaf blotch virus TaxID=129141 RepID=H6W0Y7_9VIRU|nr:coat protein [Citrus leaf blotch virus]AZD25566.1 coat protein [Citrus leaf blotch virus]AZD25568.1 coat protein [Citrus leaf blotch virus]AZD25571.1 coat protein [Citrus leaf blotch virus]AZD25572.1 coat protein [Citrus leaf blotch virus]
MKITNDNATTINYWLAIVEPFLTSDEERNSDDIIQKFRAVVAEHGDTEEVDPEVFFAIFSILATKYGRVYSKKVEELNESLKAAILAGAEAEDLRNKLKDISQRYASQIEITADRELQLENLRKKGHEQPLTGSGSSEPAHNEPAHTPQLHVVNDLQQFYIPFNEYPSLTQSIGTSDVANDEHLKRVQLTLKITDTKVFSRTGFEFAISCGSRSTSDKDPYDGIIKISGKSHMRKDIAYAIRTSGITVRQFCAAFANLYWNFNLARNTPPENWRKKGFTEGTKFAAFDFFYAVGSNAAIPTEADGSVRLIRPPTNEENEANSAMRYADIYEQNSKTAGHVTSSPLYNKGSSYESKNKAKLIEM